MKRYSYMMATTFIQKH